jgi:hypothetical protein
MKSEYCLSLHRNKGVNIHHKDRIEGNRLAIILYVYVCDIQGGDFLGNNERLPPQPTAIRGVGISLFRGMLERINLS